MRAARIILVGAGAAAAIFGIVLVLVTQRFDQLLSLAAWLAGAIVVHDGIVAPATAATTHGVDRIGRRLPTRTRVVVLTTWAVAACLTLLAVPLVIAQARGARNDSVLAGDYARDLGLLWVAVAAITGLAVGLGLWRSRRTSARRPATDP